MNSVKNFFFISFSFHYLNPQHKTPGPTQFIQSLGQVKSPLPSTSNSMLL